MSLPFRDPEYVPGSYKNPYDISSIPSADMAKQWGTGTNRKLHKEYSGRLPICPYGCGREGTLLEIVMSTDGKATGIFSDYPCTCIFRAEIEVGDPPTKRKLVIGPDGELTEEGS